MRGWPRVSPALYYEHPQAAIEWLCRAFGFEVRLKIDGEDGRVEHSELTFGDDGLVMVGTAGSVASDKTWRKNSVSPNLTGQNTQDWSDRTYGALDSEKHQWFFMQRVRDAKPSGA